MPVGTYSQVVVSAAPGSGEPDRLGGAGAGASVLDADVVGSGVAGVVGVVGLVGVGPVGVGEDGDPDGDDDGDPLGETVGDGDVGAAVWGMRPQPAMANTVSVTPTVDHVINLPAVDEAAGAVPRRRSPTHQPCHPPRNHPDPDAPNGP